MRVEIPYKPRVYQQEIHDGLNRHRFSAVVCHRRFGKTVAAVNHLLRAAATCKQQRPRFAYVAPTYRMGKQAAWDYIQHYADPIPGRTFNQSELRVDLPNEGQVRIYGADDPDKLRGIYLDGVVFDEFGLMPPNVYSEVLRPALSDRHGWALFMGTPAGRNEFYKVIYGDDGANPGAKANPSWFYAEYKASMTGIISDAELKAAREDMTEDEYAQEYECSFEASVKGAIYADEISSARLHGRVTKVPYDPALPVDTDWDLGVGDSTAIWFSQSLRGGEIRVIDYYENSGEGLPHYAQVLKEKQYAYGTHWAPADIQVRELGSGRSRMEAAQQLGIRFQVVPNLPIEDGIHAVRLLFPRCWFDEIRTHRGLEALQHYRWDYNARLREFKSRPLHDWASHGADAFRYFALRQTPPKDKRPVTWPAPTNMRPYAWMD